MSEFYTSFEDLSQTEFETHADALLSKQRTSARRKQVLTYLQSVNNTDMSAIDEARTALGVRRRQNRLKEAKLKKYTSQHAFDFSKHQELLTSESLTTAQIDTLLATDDSELFLNESYTHYLSVSGDDVVISKVVM